VLFHAGINYGCVLSLDKGTREPVMTRSGNCIQLRTSYSIIEETV